MTLNLEMKIDRYCYACGNGVIATAVVCPKCGSPVGGIGAQGSPPAAKSKTAAVLLAVFLGFWTYLFTYREDKNKFWSWLIGPLLVLVVLIPGMGFTYSDFIILGVIFLSITNFASWLVAVITAAKRNSDFYTQY
jgi:hypothetical protein